MNLADIWDWSFFWDSFGFNLKTVSNFIMIIVAILAVGMLVKIIIQAVRSGNRG